MSLKINIGGSKGWKNYPEKIQQEWKILDCNRNSDYVHDLNSGNSFPISDLSVDYFYTSNTLEHVRLENQKFVFSEMYRCLKKNGKIRIVVPDFEKAAKLYLKGQLQSKIKNGPRRNVDSPPTELGYFIGWFCSPDRKFGYSGHGMVYDYKTLKYYLEDSGLTIIDEKESNLRELDFSRYRGWCLFVEAKKCSN